MAGVIGPPLSPRQEITLRQLAHRDPDWIAVVEVTARSLARKGLAEIRLTLQGWTECRITDYGREIADSR